MPCQRNKIYVEIIDNQSSFGFEEIGIISNILIAILTLALGYYVFIYQRKKDKSSDLESKLQEQKNIKLRWFQKIIIEPKIECLFNYFENLSELKSMINSPNLSEEEKIILINFVKKQQSELRKSFLDLLQFISKKMYDDILYILDNLTDSITNSISNDELKLDNSQTFEREINAKIKESYNEILSKIFNYDGN